MKSKLIRLTLVGMALFFCTTSKAQVVKPEMPFVVRDLIKFIGIWETEATVTIDTVPHKVAYRINFRRTADSFAMNGDEAYTDSIIGNLRGADLVGYSSVDSKIHWFCADNHGNAYERIGNWTDSDNLRFDHNSKRGDKKFNEITTIVFNGNDEFTYTSTSYLDAKPIRKVTGKFARRKAMPPVQKP